MDQSGVKGVEAKRQLSVVAVLVVALAALPVAAPAGAKADARPKPSCVVPKLRGDSLATARKRLTAAHCKLGKVTDPKGSAGKSLVVRSTSPKAGRREKNGSKVAVTLKVKATTPTTTTPTTTTPSLTPTFIDVNSAGAADSAVGGIVIDVTSTVSYGVGATVAPLYETPVTYTLTDGQNGQTVTTFGGTANPYTECSIVATANYPADTTETYVGEAEDGDPACDLSSITVPYSTVLLIGASYAGSSTYAPSTTESPPVGLI